MCGVILRSSNTCTEHEHRGILHVHTKSHFNTLESLTTNRISDFEMQKCHKLLQVNERIANDLSKISNQHDF